MLFRSEKKRTLFQEREDADQPWRVRTLFQGGRSPVQSKENAVPGGGRTQISLRVRTLFLQGEEDADLKAH